MALNNIKNYEEFIEYKEEIIKAIYDIRNSITNLYNLKKFEINNNKIQQNQTNSNNIIPSSISSMLGLKFNYDAYLQNFQLKNINENYVNNNINNEVRDIGNIISNNQNKSNNSQKNMGLISFKDENNNFISTSNEDNIINNSIRNRIKIANNYNMENENNNIDINSLVQESGNKPNIYNNSNKKLSTNKKEKLSLIADIVMKINSEDYFYEILTKLFGDDLTDKLMSSDVDDKLLEDVQNSIKEIEELKKKDEMNNNNNDTDNINNNNKSANFNANDNQNINEEMEEEPKRFPIEEIMNKNVIIKPGSSQDYGGKGNKKNVVKNNSGKKEKPFINATKPYGNYFDPSLQKGGKSKLDDYKK
jgi:hypothetical protein